MAIVRRGESGQPITARGSTTVNPTVLPAALHILSALSGVKTRGGMADMSAYTLPSVRTEPSENLADYTWLIYGEKGIGKTSLAAQMDAKDQDGQRVLFCMYEPGAKGLRVYATPVITSWDQQKHIVSQLEADPKAWNTLVIDPGNIAYKRCLDAVCRVKGIIHPGLQKDYGASWDAVNTEFQDLHSRVAALGLSFVVIAHNTEKETERRNGTKFQRTAPVMSGATEEFYAGVVDLIAYYHYSGRWRFLMIRGDEDIQAKCRVDGHFITPNGEPVIRIPMGESPQEAWLNIQQAFHNKQKETWLDIEVTGIKKSRPKQKVK